MLRGINQQKLFEDNEDYEKFLQLVEEAKTLSGFKLYAYCLMGNHIHLLLKEEVDTVDIIMKRIASRFVYWYNVKYQRSGHLFQDRFKSEPVDETVYFKTVLRYIHLNPVKAKICRLPSEYQFSSYNAFLDNSSLIDKDFVFDLIPLDHFEEYHLEYNIDVCLDIDDNYAVRVTDEDAQKIIYKISKCASVAEFQSLDTKRRDKYLKRFRNEGLSIRQISRLTGISCGIVRKFN
jgi:REP element-mobilizing transposase RayT